MSTSTPHPPLSDRTPAPAPSGRDRGPSTRGGPPVRPGRASRGRWIAPAAAAWWTLGGVVALVGTLPGGARAVGAASGLAFGGRSGGAGARSRRARGQGGRAGWSGCAPGAGADPGPASGAGASVGWSDDGRMAP